MMQGNWCVAIAAAHVAPAALAALAAAALLRRGREGEALAARGHRREALRLLAAVQPLVVAPLRLEVQAAHHDQTLQQEAQRDKDPFEWFVDCLQNKENEP